MVSHVFITRLGNSKLKRFLSETQVLGRDVTIQEDVDTFTDRRREGDNTIDGRLSVENTDEIGEIVKDRQVVLDNDDIVVRAKQTANFSAGGKTLLDIEERGRLVEHVDVGLLDTHQSNGKTLQLTTGQLTDVTVEDVSQFQVVDHLVEVFHLGAGLDEVAHRSVGGLDSLGDLINILRLDDSLEVVLEHLCEVVYDSLTRRVLHSSGVTHSEAQNHGST